MNPDIQPSVAAMGLTKSELTNLCDQFRTKAQQAHDDAKSWRNRALILTAQIAVLRSAYEPTQTLETERLSVFIGRSQHYNHNVTQARIMAAKPALLTTPDGEQEPAVVLHAHGNVYAVLPAADALRIANNIADAIAAHREKKATP